MSEQGPQHTDDFQPARQPIFNVPAVVLAIMAILTIIHAVRLYVLSDPEYINTLFEFAFIPARYSQPDLAHLSPYAVYWTPFSYSLLHGSWTHLLLNGFWLMAFGAVVARRIGAFRFVLLCAVGSIGGAAAHYAFHFGELVPMIGASASVSACMGAAIRFAFPDGGSFARDASVLPLQSLFKAFQNRQVITFVAVWFGINFIVGSGLIEFDGSGSSVAWEAHIGGFLVGLLLFAFFDRPTNTGAPTA